MRALALACGLVTGLSFAAQAQDRMTAATCAAAADQATLLAGGTATVPQAQVDAEGWCTLDDMSLPLNGTGQLRIGLIRWRAGDIDRFITDGLPPRSLDLEVSGVRMVPETGDVIFDYLLEAQTRKSTMGFGMSIRWDGVQNAVILDQGYVEFGGDDRVDLTARLTGVDLTSQASIQTSLGTAGLRDLTLTSSFDGWFENMVLVPFGNALLDANGPAPAAQVATLKQQAGEALAVLPTTVLPEAGRAALTGFIASLPNPRGTLRLQFSAEPALDASRVMPFVMGGQGVEDLVAMLNGVRLLAIWDSAEGTP